MTPFHAPMSAKVVPVTSPGAVAVTVTARGSPQGMSTARSTSRLLSPTGSTGMSLLEQKIAKERERKDLTRREEDDAVGSWLFGRGGIRGFRCVSRV